ncbi:MAG: FN3 domain-containing metallophosphoesterase family protein [Segetibacter sp.]
MIKKYLFLFVVSTLIHSFKTFAQPQQIHLSWNSTNKNATENTMAVTWADNNLNKGTIKYGTDSKFSKTGNAISKYNDSAKIYIYKATLKGLRPNTTYYYKCGSDEDGWSNKYSFKTAPPFGSKQKFVVGVWGDTQGNEFNEQFQKSEVIVQQLKKYPIQFTIHMGDIVNNGSVATEWRGLFSTTQPVNAITPFMPVTGNHDVDNDSGHAGYQKPFPIFYDYQNFPATTLTTLIITAILIL